MKIRVRAITIATRTAGRITMLVPIENMGGTTLVGEDELVTFGRIDVDVFDDAVWVDVGCGGTSSRCACWMASGKAIASGGKASM